MKLSEQRLMQKKEQILLSAIKIVNESGFEQATMEQIAARLYMTKGSLYYYFKNKQDLLFQCHHFVLSKALVHLREIGGRELSAEDKLAQLVDAHIHYVIEEREFFHLILDPNKTFVREQLQPVLELRKQYATIFDEVIAQGIAENVFSMSDPFITRMTILGAMNWIQQWFKTEGTLTKKDIQLRYKEVILKILK